VPGSSTPGAGEGITRPITSTFGEAQEKRRSRLTQTGGMKKLVAPRLVRAAMHLGAARPNPVRLPALTDCEQALGSYARPGGLTSRRARALNVVPGLAPVGVGRGRWPVDGSRMPRKRRRFHH